jgi:L-alanine-DL-glutamate epimerase-like enolase superfamily enzyme
MLPSLKLEAAEQSWPMDKPFRTARGARDAAHVIVVRLIDDQHTGWGESVPAARYGESIASVLAQLQQPDLANVPNFNREKLQELLPAGSARNALDCALWDWEAKSSNKRVWELANLPIVSSIETSFTISLDTPDEMAAVTRAHSDAPLLKLKLGGDELDLKRVQAVRTAAPAARLIVDANESWTPPHYRALAPALQHLGVELIEQPFPADADEILEHLDHPVPVCADESCRTTADLPRLTNRYEAVNIKLDKTGGLTEALLLNQCARQQGFKIFLGCMAGTSLGIAPARLLARAGDYVDLDGPLLLAGDRHHGLLYQHGMIGLPSPLLWG